MKRLIFTLKRTLSLAALGSALLGTSLAGAEQTTTPTPGAKANRPARIENAKPGARANRQANESPAGARPGVMLEKIQEIISGLDLSADQKTQIQGIVTDIKEKAQTLRSELKDAQPQDRMEKMRQFMQEAQGKLRAVLNDEQKAAFDKKVTELRDEVRATAANGAGGIGRGQIIQKIMEHAGELNLSDDQKTQLKALGEEVRTKVEQMKTEAKGDREAARTKMQELLTGVREKVRTILTPEQMTKVREIIKEQASAGADNTGAARQSETKPQEKSNTTAPSETKDDPKQEPRTQGPPPLGENISLKFNKLDGSSVQLASFKPKPVVIMFGSYTLPVFRDRIASFEQLAREYSARAQFFIVYTKEAHPQGEWEVKRNKAEQIELAQSENEKQRATYARLAKDRLKITLPIAIDSMNDEISERLKGFPNSAAIIGRDGSLVAHQQWTDTTGLRRLLEQALAQRNAATQP